MKPFIFLMLSFMGILPLDNTLIAQNKTIKIDPSLQSSPLQKEGYVLLFAEEFTSFNPDIWNRSGPENDGPGYDDWDYCQKSKNSPKNVSNVQCSTGKLFLIAKEGEEENACPYSSAEVKSFSVSPLEEDFKDWELPPNCYVEVRAEVPECEGVGAAFYLWGLEFPNYKSEPDIFELYKLQKDRFQANFRYGDYDVEIFDDGKKVIVQDLEGDPVQLPNQYLNFGISWDHSNLAMQLNGVQYYETEMFYEMRKGKKVWTPLKKNRPYFLRIGIGESLDGVVGDCEALPDYQGVESVRIFLKEGKKAANVYGSDFKPTNKIQVCSWPGQPGWGDGDNVYVDYYPFATYSWQCDPAIEINYDINTGNNRHYWAAPKPNIAPGIYPCTLTITFPASGYQEVHTLNVEVAPHSLPAPQEILFLEEYPPTYSYPIGVVKQPGTTGYEWSDDGGLTWQRIPNSQTSGITNVFKTDDPPGDYPVVDVCVKAYNWCSSDSYNPNPAICRTIVLPYFKPSPYLSSHAPFPDPVTIELSTEPDLFELRTPVLESTTAYFWSFDEEYWFKEENQPGDTINRFGFFEPGTPPFNIFLRSEMDTVISEIYAQWVEIPDSIGQFMGHQQPGAFQPVTLFNKVLHTGEPSPDETPSKQTVEIYNLQGILIWRGSFYQYESTPFDQWQLTPGIYVAVIKAADGRILEIKKKIIVTR